MLRTAATKTTRSITNRPQSLLRTLAPSAPHLLRLFSSSSSSNWQLTAPRFEQPKTTAPEPPTPKSSQHAYLTRDPDHPTTAIIYLNRPEAKNAISVDMVSQVREALKQVRKDSTLRTLLLASTSSTIFSSGADLKARRSMSQDQVYQFLTSLRAMLRELEEVDVPTIAVMEGPALGGGLEISLGCDFRVASRKVTKLGLPETKLAIIPGAGGTQRLTRLVGPTKAKSLIYSGRAFTATEGYELGVIDFLAEEGQSAIDKAKEVAKSFAGSGPIALRAAKKAINGGVDLPLEQALTLEQECYELVLGTEDRLEGLKAFAEKRAPIYKGK
ncbi:ClpP/crotonase [Meredithblackwellia eburnea MCA 4105]